MEGEDDILSYLNLDPDHHEKIAALIPKETWYEVLIRYGLYIGAVFQMICILAVILLPSEPVPKEPSDDEDKSRASSPTSQYNRKQKNKKNKKKI
jgi:hypothetical protein